MVIVGAGPVGLRCAIELATLGARVEVLESRERYSRLQVLHLWEWIETDLISMGVKLLDPSIFANTDLRRCCTAQLQHSLLKVALLMGVRVRFGCQVDDLDGLRALLKQGLKAAKVDMLVVRCQRSTPRCLPTLRCLPRCLPQMSAGAANIRPPDVCGSPRPVHLSLCPRVRPSHCAGPTLCAHRTQAGRAASSSTRSASHRR